MEEGPHVNLSMTNGLYIIDVDQQIIIF